MIVTAALPVRNVSGSIHPTGTLVASAAERCLLVVERFFTVG